MVNWLAV